MKKISSKAVRVGKGRTNLVQVTCSRAACSILNRKASVTIGATRVTVQLKGPASIGKDKTAKFGVTFSQDIRNRLRTRAGQANIVISAGVNGHSITQRNVRVSLKG